MSSKRQKPKQKEKAGLKIKKKKQQELPKAFHFERFQAMYAERNSSAPFSFNAPSIFIRHITRKQNHLAKIQCFIRHASHSSEAKPCPVLAVMYGAELDFRQREQRELHQHHYSTRSNPI